MTAPAPDPSPKRTSREDALAVVRRLREAGHAAYFAGGCVRDQLLGLEPKDYDVATNATPDRVRQLFSNTQAVGAAFGVILVRHRRSQVEVATFRTDLKYVDGRRPQGVIFTTAEEDAKRRDFTINGMFYDPIEERVIDYVGGQEDLKNQVLRAIGEPDHRFEEDHLRLLRAVRFAARFYLAVEPATYAAIVRHAPQLPRISPERVAEELRLMLGPPTRTHALILLAKTGLLDVIFRHWPARGPIEDDRLWAVAFKLGDAPVSLGLALAALAVARLPKANDEAAVRSACLDARAVRDATRTMRQALKLSNEESEEMSETLLGLAPLLGDTPPALAQKKRFLARATAASSRRLMRAMAAQDLFADRIRELEAEFDRLAQTDYAPPPLITGDDLAAAGLKPGPVFKRVLDAVYDAQLEDRVSTKDAALELALELARGK
jgi:poly(A) polymerase